MSDNIPFDIQMEIIKRLPVKPLLQFRSVSKPWKSFIDNSDFIKGYSARHTQPRSRILRYETDDREDKYVCLVDDDIETFKVQQQQEFVVSPFLKQYCITRDVGACDGLLCFLGFIKDNFSQVLVIWNPSIGKSFGIVGLSFLSVSKIYHLVFGFGVCPVTSDPTIVMIRYLFDMSLRVEVFTLSSGVWNVIPSSNLLRPSILPYDSTHAVIDKFIYWGAWERTFANGKNTKNHMLVSFDLITKDFKVVNLPDRLTNELSLGVSVSKLRGSLVVFGDILAAEGVHYGVWVMEHDSSFRKLFKICAPVVRILGFKENGETIFETQKELGSFTTIDVYDPRSQQIKNLGISGLRGSFFMGPYKESLLLLDHLDSHIYDDNKLSK